MTGLHVTSHREETLCLMTMRGEARLEVVRYFDDAAGAALQEGARYVLIDMRRLTFMDSASAGALLRLVARLEQAGGQLVLHGVQGTILRMLDCAGLGERFPTARDEAAARALVAGLTS